MKSEHEIERDKLILNLEEARQALSGTQEKFEKSRQEVLRFATLPYNEIYFLKRRYEKEWKEVCSLTKKVKKLEKQLEKML